MALQEGMTAPPFRLPDADGREFSLHDFRGKNIVLYFYPNDDTPTCTKEACAFRDAFPDFERAGVPILAISPDGAKSHAKFRAKYKLPFILLADEDHAVTRRYGLWKKKQMFGHHYMGVERTTFIINAAGKIARIFPKVRIKGHVESVRAALTSL